MQEAKVFSATTPAGEQATQPTSELYRPGTPFEFVGRHLLISYQGCDHAALTDLPNLQSAMRNAVKAAGATLLEEASHVFPPDGVTVVLLLSESHASIHTYPEHDSCFVDLFTCGLACRPDEFEAVLTAYLRPVRVNRSLLLRPHEDAAR